MKIFKEVACQDQKTHELLDDVICDKCGKSCMDDIKNGFEFATISAHWGYGSNKDLEDHEAHVCEKCYDGFGLKPKIEYYM